jgi:hypothetical protein
VSAQIPVSFYNINYTNNVLSYSVGGGATRVLTLTRSNYFATTLIAELKVQFLAIGCVMAISYDRASGRLTFSTAQAFSFFASGSTVLGVLGFSQTTNYASVSNTLAAPYPVSFLSIKKLRFASSALATQSVGSFATASSSLFGTVPVNAPPFGIVQYENVGARKSILRNKRIDEIDIQIYDENNRFINFNNTDWAITLAITTVRKRADTEARAFSDVVTPILRLIADPVAAAAPAAAPSIDPSMFRDETDLDFFMYQHGIVI